MPFTPTDQCESEATGAQIGAPVRGRGRRSRPRQAGALATVALVVGLVGTTVAPSTASASETVSGSYGWIQPYQVEGRGQVKATSVVPAVRVNAPVVYRSPATTGRQTVGYQAQLQVWNGYTWVDSWISQPDYWVLSPGQQWTRPAPVDFNDLARGKYYRVKFLVVWADANGRGLGTKYVTMDRSGDYVCRASSYVGCLAGPGWVLLT